MGKCTCLHSESWAGGFPSSHADQANVVDDLLGKAEKQDQRIYTKLESLRKSFPSAVLHVGSLET